MMGSSFKVSKLCAINWMSVSIWLDSLILTKTCRVGSPACKPCWIDWVPLKMCSVSGFLNAAQWDYRQGVIQDGKLLFKIIFWDNWEQFLIIAPGAQEGDIDGLWKCAHVCWKSLSNRHDMYVYVFIYIYDILDIHMIMICKYVNTCLHLKNGWLMLAHVIQNPSLSSRWPTTESWRCSKRTGGFQYRVSFRKRTAVPRTIHWPCKHQVWVSQERGQVDPSKEESFHASSTRILVAPALQDSKHFQAY